MQRESGGNSIGAVPQILERCLTEIEARGLQESGLYRIPGASSAIAMLRTQFDTGKSSFWRNFCWTSNHSPRQGQEITFFDRDYVDIFAICDVVKTWLRALPRAIFPERSYHEALQVIRKWFINAYFWNIFLELGWNRNTRLRSAIESGPKGHSRAPCE